MKITIAGSEETAAFTYRFRRGINKSLDLATILIADKDGAKTQAYPFTSKGFKEVIIEDPTGIKVFAGRVRDISTKDMFLVPECEGWLAQLNDVQIESYDTKEILKSGTTTREGVIGSVSGQTIDGCQVGGVNPEWTANQWVGYAVVFPDKLGSTTRTSIEWCTQADAYVDEEQFELEVAWYQHDHNYAHAKDWDDDWGNVASYCVCDGAYMYSLLLRLLFQTAIPKSSISSVDIYCKWGVSNQDSGELPTKLQIYNWSTLSYDTLSSKNDTYGIYDETFTGKSPDYVSSSGGIKIRIASNSVYGSGPYTRYAIDYCKVVVNYTGTLIQDVFPIASNGDDHITSSNNFENAGVLGTDPFTICKKTSEHIKILAQTYDAQKTIDVSNVVATSNYRAREWKERTALEIMLDLAEEDQTDLWLGLDQKLYYNQTYGTPSKYIDDNDVIKRFSRLTTGLMMKNEAHIWGYKYPSPSTTEVHEVRINQSSKDTFGIARTQVERDTTIYTSIDAKSRGDSIVAKNGFPVPQYTLALAGKKNADGVAVDVGNYINLNLTKCGSQNLLVVDKAYDPVSDETEYVIAQVGSRARIYAVDVADALAEMGNRLYRLMIQAAQR
jgi:hypothetical protein